MIYTRDNDRAPKVLNRDSAEFLLPSQEDKNSEAKLQKQFNYNVSQNYLIKPLRQPLLTEYFCPNLQPKIKSRRADLKIVGFNA